MSSVLTVSQLNRYLSFKIKSDIKLKSVAVRGELSEFKIHYKTGHAYFTVRDQECAIRGIMFSNIVSRLKAKPEAGMTVLVMGSINVYERDGTCQITATEITPLGAQGAVAMKTEQVKEKLKAKGVFDLAIKKPIVPVPKKIAVVTSESAAALQDIINVTGRRYPLCVIEVYPALTQGERAAFSIAEALGLADASGADTIILARGGGSAEDLAPFNEEIAVMAVYKCVTPVISAVGHETDTSLCDYAADLRAPTPSAAAELAVPDMSDMLSAISAVRARLDRAMNDTIQSKSLAVSQLEARLKAGSPDAQLKAGESRLNELTRRIHSAAMHRIDTQELVLGRLYSQLSALSPLNVLDRGYTLIEKEGRAVTSTSQLNTGDSVLLMLADGRAKAEIQEVTTEDQRDR